MAVKDVLAELSKAPGVNAAIVVSRDGFVVDAVASADVDTEAVGAMISTGLGTSETIGSTLNQGAFLQTMMEFENGVAFLRGVGEDAMLAVTSDTGAPLGAIRIAVKKAAEKLEEEL